MAVSARIVLVLRHTRLPLAETVVSAGGDALPFDRVPADRDAGSHPLGDAPAAGCEKPKGPVRRRLQVHRLGVQSVLSQAGLSELDSVMVTRAECAANDLRFRWWRRVVGWARGVAAVRGNPGRDRLPAICEGDLAKPNRHVRQEKPHGRWTRECMNEYERMS